MTNTRTKLDEAKYFLVRIIEEVPNREPFKYNLSAFLSAGRSVTLIMQKEFHEKPGFPEWYEQKKNQMRNDLLMKLMNEKRVMTIHKKPLDPRGHVKVVLNALTVVIPNLITRVMRKDGTTETCASSSSTPSLSPKKSVETDYKYYFEDINDKDIITFSQEYCTKLEKLVEECENKFV